MSIVQKGAIDGLYTIGICGVEVRRGDLLSSELNLFPINGFIP